MFKVKALVTILFSLAECFVLSNFDKGHEEHMSGSGADVICIDFSIFSSGHRSYQEINQISIL